MSERSERHPGDSARPLSRTEERARPIPVRAGESVPQPARQERASAPGPPTLEPVRFTAEGREWIARAAGHGASGRSRATAAPLLLVTFAPADAPDVPLREVVGVGRDLCGLTEDELADLLRRSRPFVRADQRERPYADPREGRKRER
jgi:hypothetical protein